MSRHSARRARNNVLTCTWYQVVVSDPIQIIQVTAVNSTTKGRDTLSRIPGYKQPDIVAVAPRYVASACAPFPAPATFQAVHLPSPPVAVPYRPTPQSQDPLTLLPLLHLNRTRESAAPALIHRAIRGRIRPAPSRGVTKRVPHREPPSILANQDPHVAQHSHHAAPCLNDSTAAAAAVTTTTSPFAHQRGRYGRIITAGVDGPAAHGSERR